MNMKTILLSLLLVFSLTFPSYSQEGKLHKAKERINQNSRTTSTSVTSTRDSRRSRRNLDSEKPFHNLITALAINLTYGLAVESVFERDSRMHDAVLSSYPYKEKHYGNYKYDDETTDYAIARLDITTNFVYESSQLYGNDLDLKFHFAKRLSLEVDYLQLFEKTSNETESFSLISAMANYHRIRTQRLDFWFGLGTMYVANEVQEFGFSYGLGAEWFIQKPIGIYVSYKGSTINNQNLAKTKTVLKYHVKKYHVSVGYEFYRLSVSDINAFSVGFGVSL